MKLIIGLGNPDKQYQNTRHNLGQTVIKKLISELNLKTNYHPKLQAHLTQATGWGSGQKKILAYAGQYMNNSGVTVKALADYYKIPTKNIYIIHDDLDLPVGDYRLQFDRGPAGHNGILSIIEHLNTQAFHRIRLGIGHPPDQTPVEKFVLLPFTPAERVIIDTTINQVLIDLKNLL